MKKNNIKAIIFDWGDTLMRDYTQYSGPMVYWPHVETIPGVEVALSQLHKNYICCVASNAGSSDSQLMGAALERVGIKEFFNEFFTSKELGANKPDIRFFREILHRLNMGPDEVVMVGNDYLKDIKPAKSINMGTVLFSETDGSKPAPCADYIIMSMSELYSTILDFNK